MKKHKLYIIILIVVLFACQKEVVVKDKTIIPVADAVGTGEILNLSDYAASIDYIPLETNDSVLISNIRKIDRLSGQYVIHDGPFGGIGKCLLFDDKGLFVSNVGDNGHGPDEYTSLWALDVNPQTKSILLETVPKCLEYDSDGRLIRTINKPNLENNRLMQILSVDSEHYISAAAAPDYRRYKAVLYEGKSDSSKIQIIYPNYYQVEKIGISKNSTGTTEGRLYRFKDKIRYWRAWDDTIFTFNGKNEIEVAYIFDLGKYKATMEWMFSLRKDYDVVDNIYPGIIYESDNYLFIQFCCGKYAPEKFEFTRMVVGELRHFVNVDVYGIFDKRTGHLQLLNQAVKYKYLGFRNDIDGGPTFWPKSISSDDKMVTWWNAEEFLSIYEHLESPSPKLKKLAENLTPEDNPVLMIVTLK